MKLWYAALFAKDDAERDEDACFIVRAANPISCAKTVENYKCTLPGHIDHFVGAAFELGIDPHSESEQVLAGPFIEECSLEQHDHNTYWRRDFPDDAWVNRNKLRSGEGYFDCVFQEDG